MARPGKEGIDYFPFDVDFFEDDKILFVTARFGVAGELAVVKLLCRIYRNGYYIHWDEDTALLFSKVAGLESPGLANNVVSELVRRGFFDKSLLDSFSILTSRGIQERYFKACERRKSVEVNQQYLLVDFRNFKNLHMSTSSTPNGGKCIHDVSISKQNAYIPVRNADIYPQRKVKERKVKESKGEVVNTAPQIGGISPDDMQKLQDKFIQLVGGIGPVQYAKIVDLQKQYPLERILEAIQIAKERDKRKLSYVEGILKSWEKDGYDGNSSMSKKQEGEISNGHKYKLKTWNDYRTNQENHRDTSSESGVTTGEDY